MKKVCCCILILLLLLCSMPVSASDGPTLVSTSAVVIDGDTGKVLFSKGKDRLMYPASITKIMTALLVIEESKAVDVVQVSSSATRIPSGYSHIALSAGEQIRVDDAMYAMMLPSANDAANALAEHVGGSQSNFAAMMNRRAQQIGATRTHFTNASGIPDREHYTTAYDMALITREAWRYTPFRRYFGATQHTLAATNRRQATRVSGYQYMLQSSREEYDPRVVGGKIGYTGQAQHTMVTVAEYNGRTLIVVVMGSTKSGKYADTSLLLDYCFAR